MKESENLRSLTVFAIIFLPLFYILDDINQELKKGWLHLPFFLSLKKYGHTPSLNLPLLDLNERIREVAAFSGVRNHLFSILLHFGWNHSRTELGLAPSPIFSSLKKNGHTPSLNLALQDLNERIREFAEFYGVRNHLFSISLHFGWHHSRTVGA